MNRTTRWVGRLREVRRLRRGGRVLRAAAVGFSRNNTGDQAAALSYFSLLSLVPLAAAFSTLLSLVFGGDAGLAAAIAQALPYESSSLEKNLDLLVGQARAVSAVGTALFFVIAFRAWARIEAAINRVWHVRTPRRFVTRATTFLLVMFWGPVLLGLLFNLRIALKAHGSAAHGWFAGNGASFVATALALTMIHWKGPSARVRFVPALAGGIAGAAGGLVIRMAISGPAMRASDVGQIYGPLAAILMLLVGFYAFWLWFLYTVELVHAWQRQGRIPARAGARIAPEVEGALALRLAFAVADGERRRLPPVPADGWPDRLDLSPDDVDRVAEKLVAAGLLVRGPNDETLRLARPAGQLRALEIWEAVVPPPSPEGAGRETFLALDARRRELLAQRNLDGGFVGPDVEETPAAVANRDADA